MKKHVNDSDDPLTDGPNGVPRFIFEDMTRQRDEAIAALRGVIVIFDKPNLAAYRVRLSGEIMEARRIMAEADKREGK